ncbi:MAG: MBL fold metallo-hydrolase [Bacteroidetes bacterium]|nr:MBL fold metallo-hydrolase [Bacteroidota bacterium]
MINLPQDNILEISLIGTGGGYGESIVIHLGEKNWVIVDSCINPKTKDCLPLKYLESKGVNIEKDVKLIICTHWHDDHILGISKLFEYCKSSIFCMARTTDTKKFLQLVGLDHNKAKNEASASSTSEIQKCFDILYNRKTVLKGAEQDKLLFSLENNEINAKVYSLSPSDFVMNEFDKEISTLISDYGCSNRKIIFQTPNEKSVALLICVNKHFILLGSDLEVSSDIRKGWLCILDNCQCINLKKASLFKLPHHGSENSYHKRIWDELVLPNTIAKITPWNLGTKLPKDKMLETFLEHTENLFITSLISNNNTAKKRERSISKAISKFNNTLYEVKYNFGIVRSRLNLLNDNEKWQTDLFGEAIKITKDKFAK